MNLKTKIQKISKIQEDVGTRGHLGLTNSVHDTTDRINSAMNLRVYNGTQDEYINLARRWFEPNKYIISDDSN